MMKNPAHPGEILRDEILPYHRLTAREGAIALGLSPWRFGLLLAGHAAVDGEIARRIEAHWGVSCDLLLSLQANIDMARRRRRRKVLRSVVGLGTGAVFARIAARILGRRAS